MTEEQNQVKQKVEGLQESVTKKHEEKETWFQKKDALKKEILDAINEIKEVKKQLDVSRPVQNQWKAERDKYNQKTKELIAQIKPLQDEQPVKSAGPRKDFAGMQRMLERMEMKIETEVMEFEKEKQLMVKIKKLKKQLDEGLASLEGRQQYFALSKEIKEAKKKADEFHKKFIEEREKSKENLGKFTVLNKKINQLKKQQQEVLKKGLEVKQEYTSLIQQVKGKYEEKRRAFTQKAEQRRQIKQQREQQRQEQNKKLLAERSRSVEEKLKAKKKLTTEDLIAFQGMAEKKV